MSVVWVRRLLKDPSGLVGALIMGGFAVTALSRFIIGHALFFLLLFMRDILATYFLARRGSAVVKGSVLAQVIAYVSSALPLFYQLNHGAGVGRLLFANCLAVSGFLLATLAIIELGCRMGISAALRGSVCRSGIYRWFRHPMYFGYAVAELSWVVLGWGNVWLWSISLVGYYVRGRLEDKVQLYVAINAN